MLRSRFRSGGVSARGIGRDDGAGRWLMLRVLGGPNRLCDGLTRRDFLHVGALGGLGLGTGRVVASEPTGAAGFGRAKACILLFLYGSPSQLETFDPKPD